jgi:hypothetical protein
MRAGLTPSNSKADAGGDLQDLFSGQPGEKSRGSHSWRVAPPKAMKMRVVSGVPTGFWLTLSAIPGLRCAPPWAIFQRSLRELCTLAPRPHS